MPINPTYPGVYIEELENPVKAIVGVSTSITAFVGSARQGPKNDPTLIHSFGEFESIFGGLWKKSTMSYALYQYFLNGGKDAIVVRVVHSKVKDAVPPDTSEPAVAATFESSTGGPKFVAKDPGSWANDYTIVIDHIVDTDQDDPDPTKKHLFNLKLKDGNGAIVEEFRNISRNAENKRFALNVLKEESNFIRVRESEGGVKALTDALPPADQPYEASGGSDGDNITSNDIVGSEAAPKTGIYSLDSADIFNLLCIPAPDPEGAKANDAHYSTVYTAAVTYCKEKKRAILLVDPPNDWNTPKVAADNIDSSGGTLSLTLSRNENAAIYYPLIKSPDPQEEGRYRIFGPCGVVAGVIAKTDAQRGIWKAPAGIDAILIGVPEFKYQMTDEENGTLNQLGINCLRVMPGVGRVVWGARTLKGADRLTNQWKYLPIRRTALYIEESLYRGTQWAVFEPNDEPLWSQIRLNVGAFMHDLFRKGAFQGSTPKEAYLVKCDKETTTQYDIDRGIVNIVVGFAPLKPAEFVMIKIQQLAGQTEAQ